MVDGGPVLADLLIAVGLADAAALSDLTVTIVSMRARRRASRHVHRNTVTRIWRRVISSLASSLP